MTFGAEEGGWGSCIVTASVAGASWCFMREPHFLCCYGMGFAHEQKAGHRKITRKCELPPSTSYTQPGQGRKLRASAASKVFTPVLRH